MIIQFILFITSVCFDVVAASFLVMAFKFLIDAKSTFKESRESYKEAQELLDKASLLAGIASPDHPMYEVKDLVAHDKLKEFAGILKARLPKGYTYSLFIMGEDPHATVYLSSANRADMTKALHEFIETNAKPEDVTCSSCHCPATGWIRKPTGGYQTEPPKP